MPAGPLQAKTTGLKTGHYKWKGEEHSQALPVV